MTRNPADYRKFFTAECEITCLHCDFLVNRSSLAKAGLLALNKDRTFHVFLNKEKEAQCAQEGWELFSDPEKYSGYMASFKAHIERAKTEIIPRYVAIPSAMSKEE